MTNPDLIPDTGARLSDEGLDAILERMSAHSADGGSWWVDAACALSDHISAKDKVIETLGKALAHDSVERSCEQCAYADDLCEVGLELWHQVSVTYRAYAKENL